MRLQRSLKGTKTSRQQIQIVEPAHTLANEKGNNTTIDVQSNKRTQR